METLAKTILLAHQIHNTSDKSLFDATIKAIKTTGLSNKDLTPAYSLLKHAPRTTLQWAKQYESMS